MAIFGTPGPHDLSVLARSLLFTLGQPSQPAPLFSAKLASGGSNEGQLAGSSCLPPPSVDAYFDGSSAPSPLKACPDLRILALSTWNR